MSDIVARLARLEAAEAARSTFAKYTFYMDSGLLEELFELFAEDAEFLAENEPGGTGGTVKRSGREDIKNHYRPLNFGRFRHHTTNVSVAVSDDAGRVELSALFLTAVPHAVKGGLYEIGLRRDEDGQWRIRRMQITSSWGWRDGEPDAVYFEPLPKLAFRGGHPVVWGEFRDAAVGGAQL